MTAMAGVGVGGGGAVAHDPQKLKTTSLYSEATKKRTYWGKLALYSQLQNEE